MKAFKIALVVLTLAPACSWACIVVPPSKSFARTSTAVFIGNATSSHRRADTSYLMVSVKVTEILKGSPPDSLEAISPCDLPINEGERVVVLKSITQFLVYPAETYERIVRAGVRGGR